MVKVTKNFSEVQQIKVTQSRLDNPAKNFSTESKYDNLAKIFREGAARQGL